MAKQRTHSLNQSLLYAVGSKSKLFEILELPSRRALDALVKAGDDENYVEFDKDDRHIECPVGQMADCHERLATLLKRIALPDYVHSQKGRSYVSNAKAHARCMPIAKTDITQYFPSTKFSHVHRLFAEDLNCPPDIAWYLTKLCTFRGHIPTGSKISNPLAFLANRPLFDSIFKYAQGRACVMTLLQDDIVISGLAASTDMLNQTLMMIRRWGLRASEKRKKTKTYSASSSKMVTGVVLRNGLPTLPNKRRKLMSDAYKRVETAQTKAERRKAILELRGRVTEADQIDPEAVYSLFWRLVES